MQTDPTPSEEYDDPAEYDLENGLDGPELPFYLSLAQETGGPVLDLACGTGFLTIPLAEAGLAVTGVDVAQNMLDHARRKAGALPIRWLHADSLRNCSMSFMMSSRDSRNSSSPWRSV